MALSFRHSAAFGKRIEFYIIGLMLKEGLDVYLPLVDDDAIDAVVKRSDGSFVEVQIKARSREANMGDAALFASLPHEIRKNYWFVFYSERMDMIWIMSSKEFVENSHQNKKGAHINKRTIWFNGKNTKAGTVHCKPQFKRFIATDFKRISMENPDEPCEHQEEI